MADERMKSQKRMVLHDVAGAVAIVPGAARI